MGWRMFESKKHPLASRLVFAFRVIRHFLAAFWVAIVALGIGVLGYLLIAGFSWMDALLNASMILAGMGPVGELQTNAGKLFASFYALFSGLVFITLMGILLVPVAHRRLHAFHLDQDPEAAD